MRIHIVICDHCRHPAAAASDRYRVEEGPWLDICWSCQRKPFKRVEPHSRGKAIAEVLGLALRE